MSSKVRAWPLFLFFLGLCGLAKKSWTLYSFLFGPRKSNNNPFSVFPNFTLEQNAKLACPAKNNLEKSPGIAGLTSFYCPTADSNSYLDNISKMHLSHEAIMVIALVMPSEKQLSEFLNFAKQNPFVKIIVFEEHLNVYETWNKCIKESDQEFLTTVNSDDFRFQHSMCLQREALKDSSADILFSDVAVIEGDHSVPARLFSVPRFFQLRHLIFQGINIPHAMPAWRRELHERLGFFDENLESSADVEFWLRCLLSNKVFMKGSFVPGIYFLNPEGVSTKQGSKGPENWAQIMDRYAWRILMKLMSPRKKESSATLT